MNRTKKEFNRPNKDGVRNNFNKTATELSKNTHRLNNPIRLNTHNPKKGEGMEPK